MKDRAVMISALAVAGVFVASGLVFGGAAGAFGSGGPTVAPPTLVSTVTADSLSDFEPAAFYTTIPVPTVAIPPTPTWQMAPEVTTPRNQPLTAAAATAESKPTTTAPDVTSTSASTPTSSARVSATTTRAQPSGITTPPVTSSRPSSTTVAVPTTDVLYQN